MRIGNKEFDTMNNTYIMGILNVTPDSFSDGGRFYKPEAALVRAKWMMDEGAAIIDIGGESTRPGHTQISVQEEIERVVPVIEKIKSHLDIPISIDTYKSEVALAAIEAGADLINDIWGLKYDSNMAGVIAQHNLPCVLMHNREKAAYGDFMHDVFEDMKETLDIAKNAGIKDENIILDPGVGFGKDYDMNLQVLKYMEDFHRFGYPMLLATSRKSVIGNALELPVNERVEGTLVTTVMAVMKRYAFVRVHDIKENMRAIKMTQTIMQHSMYGFSGLL